MAIGNAALAARIEKEAGTTHQFKTFLSRYFYLCMSLVLAAIVLWGFSRTVDANLLHGNPPRPLLLWVHGAAFSLWIAFFILSRRWCVCARSACIACSAGLAPGLPR